MTRWVMYLSLFEFEINHVPCEKHQAPDGLSYRKRSPEDSEEENAEEYLDKFIGSMTANEEDSPLLLLSTRYHLSPIKTPNFSMELCSSLMASICCIPDAPFGTYDSPTSMRTVCVMETNENNVWHDDTVREIQQYDRVSFDPAFHDCKRVVGSLFDHSLLKSTDLLTYTGHKFEYRNAPSWTWVEVELGGEICQLEVKSCGYEYMTGLKEGELPPLEHDPYMHPGMSCSLDRPSSQHNYSLIKHENVDEATIRMISHTHGKQEGEPEGLWNELLCSLKDGVLPISKTATEQ